MINRKNKEILTYEKNAKNTLKLQIVKIRKF